MAKLSIKRIAFFCCVIAVFTFLPPAVSWGAEGLFERARNLYDIREYKLALTLFNRVIEQAPENGEAWDYASWCNRYLGNWADAKAGFDIAQALLPGPLSKWVKVGLGETFLSAGMFNSAIAAFDEAIELDPEDEELVLRSLKGLALSYASLANESSMEAALSSIAEKDPQAADEARGSAKLLLEKRLAALEELRALEDQRGDDGEATEILIAAETSDDNLSNMSDRLDDAIKQETEDEAVPTIPVEGPVVQEVEEPVTGEPEEPIDAADASLWDLLTLGAPMEETLAALQAGGVEAQKIEEPTRLGSWFYMLRLPSGMAAPVACENDSDSTRCVAEEFDGKLLSLSVTSVWEGRSNNISLKDELFENAKVALDERYGKKGKVRDTGLNTEAQWLHGRSEVISLSGTADLENRVMIEVVYNDLNGLKVFLDKAGQIGAEEE